MDSVISNSKAHSSEKDLRISKLPNESTADALKRQNLYNDLRSGRRSLEDLYRVAMDNEPSDPYKQLYAALGLLSRATNGMTTSGGKAVISDPKALQMLEQVVASEDVRASVRRNIIFNDYGTHALPQSFMEKLARTSAPFDVLVQSFRHLAESKSPRLPEIVKGQFDRILNDPKLAHSFEGLFIIQDALVTMDIAKYPIPIADRRLVNTIIEIIDKNYSNCGYPKTFLDILEKTAKLGIDQITKTAAINAIKHLAKEPHISKISSVGKSGRSVEKIEDMREDAKAVLSRLGLK